MFIFIQPIYQIGGGASDGVLMRATSDKKRIEMRQYFERHGFEDVEFLKAKDFCEYLAKTFFADGRQVFFEEQLNSHDYVVKTTSPYAGHEGEIFSVGILKYQGDN